MTIKAPFNFVPLNEKVFFPEWAGQISHDIPFEDGESGVIELKITAHSPIFVRNGHTKKDATDKSSAYTSFSKVGERYFIPATSIKGTIRNVLEIMCFGKMTQIENDSFGLRDMNNSSYRDTMKKVHCGWMQKKGEHVTLIDCGEPKRLSIKEVDRLLGTHLYQFISNSNNFRRGNGRDAKLKYEELFVARTSNSKTDPGFNEKFLNSRDYLLEGTFEGKTGTIILTGQPGVREYKADKFNPKTKNRGMWVGKEKEFIFPYTNNEPMLVPADIFNAFKTIHKNTPDYTDFWAKKLQKGERIPVFFQYEENSDGILHSIGLSFLYKYPFKRSVSDGIYEELKSAKSENMKPDLCESLFGYTGEPSLKGRVQFGHAMGFENILPDQHQTVTVSSSPHASYYPLYLGLDHHKKLQNWDNASLLAGRKRYPVRNKIMTNAGTENMENKMYLLKSGAVFKSKIRFHNLKPIEIGALLSALTFHDQKVCYHNLGFGKPLGYGKVNIEATLASKLDRNKADYMNIFEHKMDDYFGFKWRDTPQIAELFAMAKGIPENRENEFSYMKMSTNRNDNEFVTGKKLYDERKEYLRSYTSIINREPFLKISQSITDIEDKAGFMLEEGRRYRAFLEKDKVVCILDPDRNSQKKLRCKFELSPNSLVEKYDVGCKVNMIVTDIYEDDIDINIVEILPPRN